jgi:branched-chain amino acid transport system ATP-binding protein
MNTEPILRCEALTRRYGALAAVHDVSFEVPRGLVLGVGGPNGAGKTTLFELISGFTPLTSGRVFFAGNDITGLPPHEIARRGIARMFQSATSFQSLTVLENVMLAATHRTGRLHLGYARAARDAAAQALEWAGLSDKARQTAGALPVIDRKRLMLASAWVMQPALLLLDEPVGGLAPQECDAIGRLVRSATAQGVTVILIEHVMRFMLALADRVLILHHGEKLFEGTPEAFTRDPRVREVYLGQQEAVA